MGRIRCVSLTVLVSIILISCTATNRYALVIANADYNELRGRLGDVPKKDAYDIENKLSDLGFIVEQKLNLTGKQMQESILNFAIKLREGKEGKIGIIYYSGHGTEKEGTTYLIPVNAYLYTQQIDQLISLNTLINTMDDIDGRSAKIVILDACQDDGSGKIGRLAKPIDFPSTLVAYAALPGKTASNEPTEDGNSLYAKALLEALNKRGRSAQNVFNEVKKRVAELSSGRQQPYHSQSGPLDFVFNPFRGLNIPQAAH